jgi:lysophospholipase L1-like esterase
LQRVYNFFVPRPLTTRPAQHLSDKIKPMAARVSVTGGALLLTHIALSAAEAPEPNYIVALGASGIHGKGVPLGEAYPAQLETMLRAAGFNVRVINAGVDGDTTARMLMRMDSVVPAGTKVTILQPGTNDFRNKRSLSVDQHLANVERSSGDYRHNGSEW